jgi:hypothetical protein
MLLVRSSWINLNKATSILSVSLLARDGHIMAQPVCHRLVVVGIQLNDITSVSSPSVLALVKAENVENLNA